MPQTINPQLPLVLLVEDSAIALTIAESIITHAGCRVISAQTGEEALKLFQTNSVSLVLTDLGLPGLSGNELATQIRLYEQQTQKTPIPIVGLTAHALASAENEALHFGMNQLLEKPLKFEAFTQLINHFCKLKKQAAQAAAKVLPLNDETLPKLDAYPLLDLAEGIKNLGSEETLKKLLKMMSADSLVKDIQEIQKAYNKKNWAEISAIAVRIKGGAIYCETQRLIQACQHLENHQKASPKELEGLYQQFIVIAQETKKAIDDWLAQNPL